jgi:hypothetical protein
MTLNKDAIVKIQAQLFWTKDLQTISTAFDTSSSKNDKYFATIGALSASAVKALADIGIIARTNEKYPEQGHFIKAKSKFKFEPKDDAGEPVDPSLMGNGTKAVIGITTYTTKVAGKQFVQPSVKFINVKEIVTYVAPENKEDDLNDIL